MNSMSVSPVGAYPAESQLGSPSETGKSVAPPRPIDSACLYAAFLLVGCGCGWLLNNNIYVSFAASYASVQESNFYGATTVISGAVSIGLALLYALFTAVRPGGLSKRSAQAGVGALCFMTVCGMAVLAAAWDVRDAEGNYPVLLLVFGFSLVIATMTFFVAFPLVTVHYGGWLIAPFRAGTDLSQMLCAMLSEAQAPLGAGGPHLFPSWVLQVLYAAFAAAGLASWMGIVSKGAGLRREAEVCDAGETPSKAEVTPGGRFGLLRGFACPASLVWPVLLGGIMTQVNLWALTVPMGNSSARMTDPKSCDGAEAAALYKVALTVQYCLVPFSSLLSSVARCPRPVFYGLFLLQCVCVVAMWLCLLGVGRETFWQTAWGRSAWGAAFALTGALEGYLLTMTYRYVGDDPGLAVHLRDSASRLTSWGGVVVVNLLSLAIGVYMLGGGLSCTEPGA